jgi:hypothetical protein
MTDCSNADIRDRLPELVHRRLDGESLVIVRAHLVDCTPCRDEVLLLERARAALILATPRVDTAAIAHALPTPRFQTSRRSFDWRIAAAIAVLAVGGGSLALMYDGWSSAKGSDTLAMATTSVAGGDGSELPISSDLSGLTDEQLTALVGSVEAMEALPSAEAHSPAAVSSLVPVMASHDSSGAR